MLFRVPGARVVVARRLGGRPLFTPPACAHWLPWRAAEASGLVTHQAGRAGCRGAQGRPPLGSFGRWQRRLTEQDMAADVVLYARHPHALAGLPCFCGADVIVQCLQCLLPQFCLRSRDSPECAECRRRDEAGTWLAVGSSAGAHENDESARATHFRAAGDALGWRARLRRSAEMGQARAGNARANGSLTQPDFKTSYFRRRPIPSWSCPRCLCAQRLFRSSILVLEICTSRRKCRSWH
jgi:hypothetical protein